jgi:bifunctional DNase/RNase
MKRVKIADIIERQGDNKYSLLLLEENSRRAFVVNIGLVEAWAIITGLKKIEIVRPKTHQLLLNILNTTNFRLKEVNITETIDKIFYAKVKFHNGVEELEMDSRPSDGVALAVHMDTPIFVSAKVLDEFSIQIPEKYKGAKPNQKGIASIIEMMERKNAEAENHRKTKTRNYITETTKEIITQVFSE